MYTGKSLRSLCSAGCMISCIINPVHFKTHILLFKYYFSELIEMSTVASFVSLNLLIVILLSLSTYHTPSLQMLNVSVSHINFTPTHSVHSSSSTTTTTSFCQRTFFLQNSVLILSLSFPSAIPHHHHTPQYNRCIS